MNRRPRAHWLLLAVVLLTVAASQVLWGFSRGAIGRASTQVADESTPENPPNGPTLFERDGEQVALPTPARKIALTFDDGPDARWTPQLLQLLKRLHVPATFFVVGSRVLEHPGIVREAWHDGHDIGLHTYTHADMETAPEWRQRMEMSLSQTALESAIGHRSTLMRLPYSSTADSVTKASLAEAHRLTRDGYTVVYADRDGEDWRKNRRPEQIVAGAQPEGDHGAIVLLHDGGGDRRHTLAAVETLVRYMKARGDTFVTLSQMAGVPRATVNPPVSTADAARARTFSTAYKTSGWMAKTFTVLAIVVAVLMLLRALLLIVFSHRHRRVDRAALPPGHGITVLVPAYNEEAGIRNTVRSLLASELPPDTSLDVIVIDDGSSDNTLAILETIRDARLRVITQANAGKSAALNAGLQHARYEMVVTVDGDTVFRSDALARLVAPLLDPSVGAVSGNTKVTNRGRLLGRWQHIEYVIGFNLDRRMYDVLGCMPTVPGAIGAFRGSTLRRIGGFSEDTLAEDTDVTMAIHRVGDAVVYVDDAIAYTEAPATWGDLWRQRYRWCYGTLQSIWKHTKGMIAAREKTRLGFFGIPYVLVFQVLLALVAPVVDIFAIVGFIFGDRKLVLVYFCAFTALQLGITAYALRTDNESLRTMWVVPLQQFVYRQLMYLVVIQSIASALNGKPLRWHRVRRYGTTTVPDAAHHKPSAA